MAVGIGDPPPATEKRCQNKKKETPPFPGVFGSTRVPLSVSIFKKVHSIALTPTPKKRKHVALSGSEIIFCLPFFTKRVKRPSGKCGMDVCKPHESVLDVDWDLFLKHCLHHPESDCVEWLGSRRGTQPVAFQRKTRGRVDARILYYQLMTAAAPKKTGWKGQGIPVCKTPQCLNWHHYMHRCTSKKRKRSDE